MDVYGGYKPTMWGTREADGQADLKAGRLPAAAAQLFHGSPSKPEPKPKRLRMWGSGLCGLGVLIKQATT